MEANEEERYDRVTAVAVPGLSDAAVTDILTVCDVTGTRWTHPSCRERWGGGQTRQFIVDTRTVTQYHFITRTISSRDVERDWCRGELGNDSLLDHKPGVVERTSQLPDMLRKASHDTTCSRGGGHGR